MLNNKHLFFFIIQAMIGVSLLSLPNSLYKTAGHDGWMSIILSALIIQILIIVMWLLYKRFPNDSLLTYSTKLTGKWIGNAINILYICYFLQKAFFVEHSYAEIIRKRGFFETPSWALIGILLLTVFMIAKEQPKTMARAFLFFSLFFIPILAFVIYSYKSAHLGRVLPIGESGFLPIVFGIKECIPSLTGIGAFLFLGPFLSKNTKPLKILTIANISVSSFYLLITFTCFVFFSGYIIQDILEIVIYLFRNYSTFMIDKVNILFLSFWVIPITTSIVIPIYLASISVQHYTHQASRTTIVFLFVSFLFIISFFKIDYELALRMKQLVPYIDAGFIFLLPIILLLTSFFRKEVR